MSDSDSVFRNKTHQPADANNQAATQSAKQDDSYNNSDEISREEYRNKMNQDDQKAKFERDFEEDLAQSEAAQVASEDQFARRQSKDEIITNNSNQNIQLNNANQNSFVEGEFEPANSAQTNSNQNQFSNNGYQNNYEQTNSEQNNAYNNSYQRQAEQADQTQNQAQKQSQFEQPNYNNTRIEQPKKHHYGRWILGGIVVLFTAIGIGTWHEISELKNTQRTQDTMLDSLIKREGKELAEKEAPKNIRPQIIKVIETVPLSQIQQAANNEQEFAKLAEQVNLNQQEISDMQSIWFSNNNQELRQAIQNGNALQGLAGLRQLNENNSK